MLPRSFATCFGYVAFRRSYYLLMALRIPCVVIALESATTAAHGQQGAGSREQQQAPGTRHQAAGNKQQSEHAKASRRARLCLQVDIGDGAGAGCWLAISRQPLPSLTA